MKNRSITYLLLFGICSMLAIMQSCQKTDDLEADINSLKDRVAALEKATEGLNTSFAIIVLQSSISIAFVGHILTQTPQPLHCSLVSVHCLSGGMARAGAGRG